MVDERMVETNQVVQLNLLRTWWVPWVRVSPHASWAVDSNQNPSWVGPHPLTRGGMHNIERVPSRRIMYLSRASSALNSKQLLTCLISWGLVVGTGEGDVGKGGCDGWGKKEWCNLKFPISESEQFTWLPATVPTFINCSSIHFCTF